MKIRGKLISSFGAVTLAILLVYAIVVYVTFSESILQNQTEIYDSRVRAATLTTENLLWDHIRQVKGEDSRARIGDGRPTDSVLFESYRRVRPEKFDQADSREVLPVVKGAELEEALRGHEEIPLFMPQLLFLGEKIFLVIKESAGEDPVFSVFEVGREILIRLLQQNLLLDQSKLLISKDGQLLLTFIHPAVSKEGPLFSYGLDDLEKEETYASHAQGRFVPLSENMYLFSAHADFFGLHLDYLLPSDIFLNSLSRLKNRVVAATIVLAWIAVWVVLIVAYRLSKPILKLAKVTNDMIAFNYSTPFEFSISGDEIGDLARSVETMRQKIENLVTRDPLTKTFNRRYLMHMFKLAFAKAKRNHEQLACVIMDIDYFKKINDTYGHQAGDDALRAVGALLQESTRPYDTVATVARYGGEEFVLLLPGVGVNEAVRVAERLRRSVEEHAMPHGIKCTMSLGVAALEADQESPDKLLNEADKALYRAKEQGRNRVVAAPDDGTISV